MPAALIVLLALSLGPTDQLGPGNHRRTLTVGDKERSYLVHVPPGYDAKRPTPLVVALHGAAMNAKGMEIFSGLSKKADQAGFVVVYPNGTGLGEMLLTWNAGLFQNGLQKDRPDDVAFLGKVLDDVANVVNVDRSRVYATGMSNGAMMAYRLAAELPGRFAAVAGVGGTLAFEQPPKRPIPILHFHGTEDKLVPFLGTKKDEAAFVRFPGAEASLKPWLKANGCTGEPTVTKLPTPKDKYQVVRKAWTNCQGDAEVVLYVIEGGGHTWPGMKMHAAFLGATTYNISANDIIWEFFQRHRRK